jgi:hypothetical protein
MGAAGDRFVNAAYAFGYALNDVPDAPDFLPKPPTPAAMR